MGILGKERRLQLINELRTRQTIRKATELHMDGKNGPRYNAAGELIDGSDENGQKDGSSRKLNRKESGNLGEVEYESSDDEGVLKFL